MLSTSKYLGLAVLLILIKSCSDISPHDVNAGDAPLNTQKVDKRLIELPPLLTKNKKGAAILSYLEKTNCRVPEVNDFSFSDQELEAIKYSSGNFRVQTIAFDSFDNDSNLDDFAVMLVNKDDKKPDCFRLVFFFESKTGYKSEILLNHINLSKSTMTKSRYGWSLVSYGNDKVAKSCQFGWNAKTEKMECN